MSNAVKQEGQDIRLYQYTKIFGEPTKQFAPRFELPKLTLFDQKDRLDCVGHGLATAAEILFGKMFSPSFGYSMFRDESHEGAGLYFLKAVDYFCKIGSVPFADFGYADEVPFILEIVREHPELLEIAKKYKPSGYCNINYAKKDLKDKCIKDALSRYEEGVAVVAVSHRFFGLGSHCVAIVGWNDETDSYIYQNSYGTKYEENGRGEIPKSQINEIVAIFLEPFKLPFTDVEGHWGEKGIQNMHFSGIINGYEDGTFRPDNYLTRAELCTILNRYASKNAEVNTRIWQVINEIDDKFEELIRLRGN